MNENTRSGGSRRTKCEMREWESDELESNDEVITNDHSYRFFFFKQKTAYEV